MSRWRQWRDHWSWQEEGWWIKAMQERGKVEKHETRFWSALQGWLVDHNSWSSQTNTINKQQGWLVALNICSYKPKPLTCWVISLLCLCLCFCVCLFHCLCHLQTLPWSYPYRKYMVCMAWIQWRCHWCGNNKQVKIELLSLWSGRLSFAITGNLELRRIWKNGTKGCAGCPIAQIDPFNWSTSGSSSSHQEVATWVVCHLVYWLT